MSERIAIVAAMEREVAPFLDLAVCCVYECQGRRYTFYERDGAALVCGGMGAQTARAAAKAILAHHRPDLLVSAGFAGAAAPERWVASLLVPAVVVDASSGEKFSTRAGQGVLVSSSGVCGRAEKAAARARYQADAVDMEAAAVAQVAREQGVQFLAVKAISDAADFPMPPLGRFIGRDGRFRTLSFAAFAALRPWLWPRLRQLRHNSAAAARSLSAFLQWMVEQHHGGRLSGPELETRVQQRLQICN